MRSHACAKQCISRREDLRRRERIVADEVGERDAAIFSLHRTILQDPATHKDVESMIREQRINAEAAVQTLIERFQSACPARGRQRARLRGRLQRSLARRARRADASRARGHGADGRAGRARRRRADAAGRDVPAARARPGASSPRPAGASATAPCWRARSASRASWGCRTCSRASSRACAISVDGDAGTVQLRPDQEDVDRFLARLERRKARLSQAQHARRARRPRRSTATGSR